MKRIYRTLVLACVVVGALAAVSAAGASAAPHFKASAKGSLKGTQTGNQVFTTGAGEVSCTKAATTGTVTNLEAVEQEVAVKYTGCTAFSFVGAEISEAKYNLHANGEVDVLNSIKITVPLAGCSVTVSPQKGLKAVTYTNVSGKIEEASKVESIVSKGTGGICGGENKTGSYKGSNLVELVGGTVEWLAS